MRLEFDEETGAVYRITALKTGWDIMNSRESGLSWRIMIPLSEELRNNNALGEKQRLSSYPVSYTHLDVYKRQANPVSFDAKIFHTRLDKRCGKGLTDERYEKRGLRLCINQKRNQGFEMFQPIFFCYLRLSFLFFLLWFL